MIHLLRVGKSIFITFIQPAPHFLVPHWATAISSMVLNRPEVSGVWNFPLVVPMGLIQQPQEKGIVLLFRVAAAQCEGQVRHWRLHPFNSLPFIQKFCWGPGEEVACYVPSCCSCYVRGVCLGYHQSSSLEDAPSSRRRGDEDTCGGSRVDRAALCYIFLGIEPVTSGL